MTSDGIEGKCAICDIALNSQFSNHNSTSKTHTVSISITHLKNHFFWGWISTITNKMDLIKTF